MGAAPGRKRHIARLCAVCHRIVNRGGGRRSKLAAEHWLNVGPGHQRCPGSDLPRVETTPPGPPGSAKPGAVACANDSNVVRVDFIGARRARLERGALSRVAAKAFVLHGGA